MRLARPQQVTDRLRRLAWGEQLVRREPFFVEELAEVVAAGIGTESNDQVIAGEAPGIAQRRRHRRAAGAANEQAFAAGQSAGRVE